MTIPPSLNLKSDFPIFQQATVEEPLVYLDNAASSQIPEVVIQSMNDYFRYNHANVHRGLHRLSERATSAYEDARHTVQEFINASTPKEIVFVRGTTEAINLVAQSFLKPQLQTGDSVLVTEMEHHSNWLPWQRVCQETGAHLQVIAITSAGELNLAHAKKLLETTQCRLLALTHISNVMGTLNPLKQLIEMAHQQNVPVLVDGAQAVAHLSVDVQTLDCDFYAFSGHKMHGPTGIGVLYGKTQFLEAMAPYQLGGGMVFRVSQEKSTFQEAPTKFEAGTPNVVGAVGLATAIHYLKRIDYNARLAHEQALLTYAKEQLSNIPQLSWIGTPKEQLSALSFVIDKVHPHDVSTILDHHGIAVRAGHHCAQPLMHFFKVPATIRVSLACYNEKTDIDALVEGLHQVQSFFQP